MSDTEQFGYGEPQKPKRGLLVPIIAVLAVGAAGGLGYAAWNFRAEKRDLASELEKSKKASTAHQAASIDLKEQVTGCEADKNEESARRTGAEGLVATLKERLETTKGQVVDLKKERAQTEAQLREFRAITAKFQRMIDSGKLKVIFRRGRMIVKLPASVLFSSGSDELSEPGKQAIRQVARVLKSVPNRRFVVGGHTDNIPVNNEKFKNNWQLSASRAVQVTQQLIRAGMWPRTLSLAGFGSFDPVAGNGTPLGRQRNRRIEIILEPRLTKLPPRLAGKKKPGLKKKPLAKPVGKWKKK